MHVPGLKVVAPATPFDAKGCLAAAVRDDDPVLYVEHRLLHFQQGPVPEAPYVVVPGKARVTAPGGYVLFSFSGGPETPIWVPPERLRQELGERGFTDFADFQADAGTAFLARKADRQ